MAGSCARLCQSGCTETAVAPEADQDAEIGRLGELIDSQAAQLETMDTEHSAGVDRGYTLDAQIRETGSRANSSAVELERIAARPAVQKTADIGKELYQGPDKMPPDEREKFTKMLSNQRAVAIPTAWN